MAFVLYCSPWTTHGVVRTGASAAEPTEETCWCDGWASTNTVSAYADWQYAAPGMSYRGSRNKSRLGVKCVSWDEAYKRCSAGATDVDEIATPDKYKAMLIHISGYELYSELVCATRFIRLASVTVARVVVLTRSIVSQRQHNHQRTDFLGSQRPKSRLR